MATRKKAARGKRERLAQAAVNLAYRRGFGRTTLADIAEEAGVPVGNLYYYFKTKHEIGETILAKREAEFALLRDELARLAKPLERLVAFVDSTVANARLVATSGCPMGSLSAELLKDGGPLAERSRSLFADPLNWMKEQFREMGCKRNAGDLALQLLASLQGAMMLTHSFRDPSLLQRECGRLRSWLEELAETRQ